MEARGGGKKISGRGEQEASEVWENGLMEKGPKGKIFSSFSIRKKGENFLPKLGVLWLSVHR